MNYDDLHDAVQAKAAGFGVTEDQEKLLREAAWNFSPKIIRPGRAVDSFVRQPDWEEAVKPRRLSLLERLRRAFEVFSERHE